MDPNISIANIPSSPLSSLPDNADLALDSPSSKHHSKEADELDFLCRKLTDVRVRNRVGVNDEDMRLSDVSEEQFLELVRNASSPNTQVLRDTVIKFRKLLAHEDIHPYLERIIASGVVPNFVQLLAHVLPELQFEAAWILTNVAAGTSSQTAAVVRCKAIPALISLLQSPFKDIREQSVWCLGNIAGDSVDMRSSVLNEGALEPVIQVISSEMNEFLASSSFHSETVTQFTNGSKRNPRIFNLSTLRIAMWALSNICRGNGKSALDWNLIDIAMPVLSQVLTCCSPGSVHSDDEILTDACWALSRILRGIHEGVNQIIVNTEVCAKLGALVCHENSDVQIPALRCLINIVSGGDAQTQVVVDSGILPALHSLLQLPNNDTVQKEACLIISNVTAGTRNQVQAVIEAGIVPTLVSILRFADYRTKREACWAIGNAVLNRDPSQVSHVVTQCGAIAPLCDMISPSLVASCNDDRVVLKVLEACRNILASGDMVAVSAPCSPTKHQDMDTDFIERLAIMNINKQLPPTIKAAPDSTYASMTNVFDNAFRNEFLAPSQESGFSGLDGFKNIVALQKKQHSHETLGLASEILATWFH